MLARAGVIFLFVAVLAILALQYLVQDHVKGVSIVHAQDKAQHKTVMIERLPDIANVFAQNRVSADIRDQINQMAHDTDIVDMVFYNLSGVRIPTADAL